MRRTVIRVLRYDPQRDVEPSLQAYQVPMEEGAKVSGALQYVRDNIDSSLAFRSGCRNKSCGLCAMEINGKPRLACTAPLKSSMVIRPLSKLPVAKDLIVDRRWMFSFVQRFSLFLVSKGTNVDFPRLVVPEPYVHLSACTECLACLSSCPSYEFGRDDLGGPYHFLKLAQLQWDPRDTGDRRLQAKTLGIERCKECRLCACPLGIPVYRYAVAPLASVG